MMWRNKFSLDLVIAGWLICIAPHGHAVEVGGVDLRGSGFLTLAAGTVLNGGAAEGAGGYACPCVVTDYANAAIYEKGGVQWLPDSKLGLQGSAVFDNRYSLTGQIVARGSRDGDINLEWLYGNIRFNNTLTLQIGRKRLPLFYYSEIQDVGQAYPWVHLPPQAYGWEIVNYNGVNLLYEDQWGSWSSGVNLFAGSETVKDNSFWKIYNGKNSRTDSRWSDIAGVNLNLGLDWFETRMVYIQSKMQDTAPPGLVFGAATRQKIYGVSFAADYQRWVVRSEFQYINRKESYGGDHAQIFGLGYRFGKLLPMVTYANYRQSVSADQTLAEAHSTASLLLRYNLTPASDIKLQYGRWQNHADPGYFALAPSSAGIFRGATLLSASYDIAF